MADFPSTAVSVTSAVIDVFGESVTRKSATLTAIVDITSSLIEPESNLGFEGEFQKFDVELQVKSADLSDPEEGDAWTVRSVDYHATQYADDGLGLTIVRLVKA
jgi:hypothetical protein